MVTKKPVRKGEGLGALQSAKAVAKKQDIGASARQRSALLGGGIGYSVSIDANRRHLLLGIGAVAIIGVLVGDLVHHVHTVGNSAECGISAVEVRGRLVHDEELAACGIRMHGARHGQDALRVSQIIFETVLCEFARDRVTGTARTHALRAATLDHETIYNAMES